MAEIKADATQHQQSLLIPEDEVSVNVQKLPKPKRVASLDIFRGLTVAVQSFNHFIGSSVVEFGCFQVGNFSVN